MKFILQIILFCLMPIYLTAQNARGNISGRVMSDDLQPVEGLKVSLLKASKNTTTDAEGFFAFYNIRSGADTLVVSSADKIHEQVVEIPINNTLNVGEILIGKLFKQLKEVRVVGHPSYETDYSTLGTKVEAYSLQVPQAISTVNSALLSDKMIINLKDAVDNVAGVSQYSGYDEYTIRGFRAENARLINGLRGYNTTYTNPLLLNIGKIEILKGPSSTLYGNGDPGGTINMITKKPLKNTVADIELFAGSWEHFRIQGGITGALDNKNKFLGRLNAGYDQNKSFRYQSDGKSWQIAPSFSFFPNDKLEVNADFSISAVDGVLDRGQPGLTDNDDLKATSKKLNLSQPGDYLKETNIASTVSVKYKITGDLHFNLGYLNYLTRQKVANHGFESYASNDSVNLNYTTWKYNTATNTVSAFLTYDIKTGPFSHRLLGGYDFVHTSVDLNQKYYEIPDRFGDGLGIVGRFSLLQPQYAKRHVDRYKLSEYDSEAMEVDGERYYTQGIYLQDMIKWNKWILLVGIRNECYRSTDDEDDEEAIKQNVFLPRIGLTYLLQSNIAVYATFNKGFDPFEAAGELQIFTDKFKPVTSQLFEVGLKSDIIQNRLSASLAVYQITLDNVAVNANDLSNPNLFVQQGENRSRGVEIELNGNILPNLSLSTSYAYNETKITKSRVPEEVGTIANNAPGHTSNGLLKYSFAQGFLRGLSLLGGYTFVSKQNTLQKNFTLPAYFLLDAELQYSYQKLTLSVNIKNIADKDYWYGAYNNVYKWAGMPRNIMAGLKYTL